jgi:TadE-like protein
VILPNDWNSKYCRYYPFIAMVWRDQWRDKMWCYMFERKSGNHHSDRSRFRIYEAQFRWAARRNNGSNLARAIQSARELRKDTSGTSAIEFALNLPIFLALMFGILCYGMYIGACHSVSQLAADAARASVAGLTMSERQSIAQKHVSQNITSYPLLALARTTVSAVELNGSTSFQISVAYDASHLPIYLPFIPSPQPIIQRAAIVTNGGI